MSAGTSGIRSWDAIGRAVAAGPIVVLVSAVPLSAQGTTPAEPAAPRPLDALPPAKSAALSEGFGLIAAVILIGLGLVVATMLFGWRTRRMIRQPLPKATPPDELWFLKGKAAPKPPDASPE